MEIEILEQGDVTVIIVTGKLNVIAAARLKRFLDKVVADGQPQLVVDLSGVEFIDASGLGALIGSLKSARQAAGDLRIAGAREQVQSLLRATNLDQILRLYGTVQDALEYW